MKPAKTSNSRRAFLRTTALGLGAIGAGASSLGRASAEAASSGGGAATAVPVSKGPSTEIAVWYTNAKQRFAAGKPISWQPAVLPAPDPPPADSIQLVPANKFQDILGFGGCFSDAACYVINQLHSPLREQLLHEMFHPSEMGLSVNRTCIGSA